MAARGTFLTSIYVTDYDCVSCFGVGATPLWQNLLAGENGFKPVKRFEVGNYVNNIAATCDMLDDLALGSRFPAIMEALLGGVGVSSDAVLLTATTKDNIELLECQVRNKQQVTPVNTIGNQAAELLGVTRPARNINVACASGSTAVMYGCEMIASGIAEEVVVCGCDLVSEFVFSGFSVLKAMSPTIGRPFDIGRDGLILGESAAYIVLMSEERMKSSGKTAKGKIAGWGGSSDAFHITAPDRNGKGLQRAISKSLSCADIDKCQIRAINAHGTGTIFNDAMEITAFKALWFESIPYFYSIKGAVGHCIGPCGLLEVITSLLSFAAETLPATTGNEQPEPELAKSMMAGNIIKNDDYALSVNSGFGGVNTALVLTGGGNG